MTRQRPRTAATAALIALALTGPMAPMATGSPARATVDTDGVAIALPDRADAINGKALSAKVAPFVNIWADNVPQVLDVLKAGGVKRVQVTASFSGLCPTGPKCDFTLLDKYFAAASQRGLSTLVHVNSAPTWVHTESGVSDIWMPPVHDATELQHWTNFTRTLAARYANRRTADQLTRHLSYSLVNPRKQFPLP